ncbi:hypothetical protein RJ641_035415 [Dillenia turbinata]|uniref:DUF7054 domain-containing protein n=1 Tax=Dillenia turbinata TaxID=194707 RepID=A0AAN8VJ94_9MAGN
MSDLAKSLADARERHSEMARTRGGVLAAPNKLLAPPEKTSSSSSTTTNVLRPTKLLLNVTIDRSVGPMQVIMSPENTVADFIKAALEAYAKEKRRPLLIETDPKHYALHYSQYSLESLKADEKLINLGSRNFYLHLKPKDSKGEDKVGGKSSFPLTRLMNFLI